MGRRNFQPHSRQAPHGAWGQACPGPEQAPPERLRTGGPPLRPCSCRWPTLRPGEARQKARERPPRPSVNRGPASPLPRLAKRQRFCRPLPARGRTLRAFSPPPGVSPGYSHPRIHGHRDTRGPRSSAKAPRPPPGKAGVKAARDSPRPRAWPPGNQGRPLRQPGPRRQTRPATGLPPEPHPVWRPHPVPGRAGAGHLPHTCPAAAACAPPFVRWKSKDRSGSWRRESFNLRHESPRRQACPPGGGSGHARGRPIRQGTPRHPAGPAACPPRPPAPPPPGMGSSPGPGRGAG